MSGNLKKCGDCGCSFWAFQGSCSKCLYVKELKRKDEERYDHLLENVLKLSKALRETLIQLREVEKEVAELKKQK